MVGCRKHAVSGCTVWAGWALVDISHLCECFVSTVCPIAEAEVKADEMLAGKTEEWFDAPVILDDLPDDKSHQNAQSHFAVVFIIHGDGPIPANACFQVGAAKGGSVGCGNTKIVLCRTRCCINKWCRGAKRVEIDTVKTTHTHQGIGIIVGNLNRKVRETVHIFHYQFNRTGILIVDRNRNPTFFCHPKTPDAAGSHRVQIMFWLNCF